MRTVRAAHGSRLAAPHVFVRMHCTGGLRFGAQSRRCEGHGLTWAGLGSPAAGSCSTLSRCLGQSAAGRRVSGSAGSSAGISAQCEGSQVGQRRKCRIGAGGRRRGAGTRDGSKAAPGRGVEEKSTHLGLHGEVKSSVIVLRPDELQRLQEKSQSRSAAPATLRRAPRRQPCTSPNVPASCAQQPVPRRSRSRSPPQWLSTRGMPLPLAAQPAHAPYNCPASAPRICPGSLRCGSDLCGHSRTAPARHGSSAARQGCLGRGGAGRGGVTPRQGGTPRAAQQHAEGQPGPLLTPFARCAAYPGPLAGRTTARAPHALHAANPPLCV